MKSFTRLGDKLYFVIGTQIQYIQSKTHDVDDSTTWSVTTGEWGLYLPDYQYVIKLVIKLQSDNDVSIHMKFDDKDWEKMTVIKLTNRLPIQVPIIPVKCGYFRVKVEGKGNCTIYSIVRMIEQGSDSNVK